VAPVAAFGTYLRGINRQHPPSGLAAKKFGNFMRRVAFTSFGRRTAWAAIFCASLLLGTGSALAQSGDQRAQEQSKQGAPAPAPDLAKELAEAAQAINGPAGNPECVWLGKRVVNLMVRDDLDTAFRHLDLYDRFGCPGGHVQAAFRCFTRMGNFDLKAPDALNSRVQACWVNPALTPPAAATTATAPAASASAPAAAAPAPAAPPAATPAPSK
jgi:hypothetical protein